MVWCLQFWLNSYRLIIPWELHWSTRMWYPFLNQSEILLEWLCFFLRNESKYLDKLILIGFKTIQLQMLEPCVILEVCCYSFTVRQLWCSSHGFHNSLELNYTLSGYSVKIKTGIVQLCQFFCWGQSYFSLFLQIKKYQGRLCYKVYSIHLYSNILNNKTKKPYI